MSAQTTQEVTGAEEVLWNLAELYSGPTDPAIEKDLDGALTSSRAFKESYHGKVATLGAADLNAAITEMERISSIATRAGDYAYMYFSTDTSDPVRGALLQMVEEKATALATELLFFTLEWVEVPEDTAARILTDPKIEAYRHFLESARKYKPYVLSEPEEKILTEKSVSGSSAWSRLFTELMSAVRVQIDGVEFPMEAALSKLQQPDRGLRQRAAESITEALATGLRTRSFIFNALLLDKSTDDRLRSYPNWISSRNLSNEASDETVNALVGAVVSRYDIPQRWYKLKARLLGLDRLMDYDRMAPLQEHRVATSWDEARATVIDAYESFSPRAGSIIRRFFDESWIDAAAGANKTPGAYCVTTVPWGHPYVLMSFTGERRSVLTLAHELGHGLHGYLAGEKNSLLNASTPLTMAETASVFGEALTFGRLLEAETDPSRRLDLLAGKLEDIIATVFRQIAMNRFEDAVHTARRSSGELSVEAINEQWAATQSALFGDSVEMSEGYKTWWSYIPHFIGSPGYVYAYAFGCLFSLAIFQRYQQEGASMVEPYLELLSAGGSDSPEILAKLVGIDLADHNFWSGGLEAVDALLAEAEQLAQQIG